MNIGMSLKEGETSETTGAVSSSDLAVEYDEENGGGRRRSDDGSWGVLFKRASARNGNSLCMPLPVTFSKFFPPPYQPDVDGPPVSILEYAKRKLLLIVNDHPDPYTRDEIHEEHLRLLTDSPGYAAYFLTSLDRYERLLDAKPVLIQGMLLLALYHTFLPVGNRTRCGRPMEASRRNDASQQDRRTCRRAHILEAHGALADTRGTRSRCPNPFVILDHALNFAS
jgi:hypothetical protein